MLTTTTTAHSIRSQQPPRFRPKPYEIDPHRQGGSLDPLSATLMAFLPDDATHVCKRAISVYDGRRRYNILFTKPIYAIPAGRDPKPDSQIVHCLGVYERVAGFKPKMMAAPA